MRFPERNGGLYEVHCSGVIAKKLRRIQRQAFFEGRGPEVVETFRRMVHQLLNNPKTFGEAIYRLPALRMQVRCAVVGPLAVDFAVCEDRPLVFIKGVTLLDKPNPWS